MRVTRRRVFAVTAAVLAALVVVWAPSLVASRYTTDEQPIDFLTHPEKGWRFLVQAVRVSRTAELGTEAAALQVARRRWPASTGVGVERVRLVYLEEPVTVAVPPGGRTARERARTVAPRSRFTWFVDGRVDGGPRQTVGLIDLASGRIFWDITYAAPRPESA